MSLLIDALFSGLDGLSLTNLFAVLLGLIVIWGVLSLPVYIAAKTVTGGRASFLAAMGATLLGPIVYSLTVLFTSFFLSAVIGLSAAPIALIVAFIAWLAVYKSVFSTGWMGALFISILAAIIFAVLSLIIATLFGGATPSGFFDVASF